jgi:hypothetical protein
MTMHDGVRYDPRGGGHVESYFLKVNDRESKRALWVKATILARSDGSEPVAESWAVAFERGRPAVAAKTTVPLSRARFSPRALDVELPTLSLSRARARGEVGEIAFDLALADETQPLLHYPTHRMYVGRFPSSKFVSPMPNLAARGEARVGDRTWTIDGWRGLLGHNWGRGHAFAYAWGHCNVWDDDVDLVLEGASGRVRVGPVLTPTTTLVLVRWRGETHALNRVSQLLRNRGSMTLRRWRFSGSGPTLSLRGEFWADTDDMVGLHYENPDGAMTYCLNSKLASARVSITPRGGLPFVASSRAAALEIGTRDAHHGVRMAL